MKDTQNVTEIPILMEKNLDTNQLALIGKSLKIGYQFNQQTKLSSSTQTINMECDALRKELRKRFLIKQIIFEVFSKSTMHGVAKIYNSKNSSIKCMWIIFLFTNISLFTTMALLSLFNYKKYDVTTKIRTIYERPTLFPTVNRF